MAPGRRGTRRITIDGRHFRWRCEFNEPLERFSVGYAKHGDTWRPDRLLVRPEDGAHRLLAVTWPACEAPIIKPRLVRACIREALRQGWLTGRAEMTLAGRDFTVPE